MTAAEAEADRILPTLLEQTAKAQAQHGKPSVIPLSVYETDHDLHTLRPEDRGQWTAAFHREVMEAIALRLRLRGYTVRLTPIDAAPYLRWLSETSRKNTPENRALFISHQ